MTAAQQARPHSRGTPVAERIAHLRRAVTDKSIHALGKNPDFERDIGNLVGDVLAEPATDTIRTAALAALGRVYATNKVRKHEAFLRDAIRSLLAEPLTLAGVDDGDDRYYIVVGQRLSDAPWIPEHLAEVAVNEESHENARREAVLGIIEKTSDLEAALRLLSQAMRAWMPTTEAPADSAAKRAKRLLAAIAEVLLTYESNAECEPGRALGALIHATIKGGVNPSDKIVADLAPQALATVHALVRSRFSLAAEPSTYDAVRAVRDIFPRDGWARWLSNSQNREVKATLQRDVSQALTLLVKQGTCDDALFGQLVLVSGSRDAAREEAKRIARTVRGLAPEVQSWLTTGERVQSEQKQGPQSTLALESQLLREDVLIARLLRDVSRFASRAAQLRESLLPELEVVAPQYVRNVDGILSRPQMIEQGLALIADRRGLRLRGRAGDVEEYVPGDHQLVDESRSAAVRRVRLVEPVVERAGSNGITVVVERALVEPVPSPTEPPLGGR
jgi:hypothetical protein